MISNVAKTVSHNSRCSDNNKGEWPPRVVCGKLPKLWTDAKNLDICTQSERECVYIFVCFVGSICFGPAGPQIFSLFVCLFALFFGSRKLNRTQRKSLPISIIILMERQFDNWSKFYQTENPGNKISKASGAAPNNNRSILHFH